MLKVVPLTSPSSLPFFVKCLALQQSLFNNKVHRRGEQRRAKGKKEKRKAKALCRRETHTHWQTIGRSSSTSAHQDAQSFPSSRMFKMDQREKNATIRISAYGKVAVFSRCQDTGNPERGTDEQERRRNSLPCTVSSCGSRTRPKPSWQPLLSPWLTPRPRPPPTVSQTVKWISYWSRTINTSSKMIPSASGTTHHPWRSGYTLRPRRGKFKGPRIGIAKWAAPLGALSPERTTKIRLMEINK